MRIPYGARSYRRDNLPELRLENMFVEQSPTDETGVVLLSRKGLALSATRGTGTIRGVFQQANVFSGDTFVVSGSTLYRNATNIGTITGSGPVSFAAGATNELAINAGASIHRYDGATLATVTFPDTANVRKILFHDGLYLALRDATHKWYWSAVLDADTWDALDFASAESKPDTLLDAEVLNDVLWLFGQETIEPWANAGNADAPYQRIELGLISKGIHSTGALTELDQALHFVGNDNIAYSLRGGAPERISDHGIEERIAASATVSCFAFIDEGHAFLCVRLDSETLVYDIATREWTEFSSGAGNWFARCATKAGDTPMFGGDSGKVYVLSGWQDEGNELTRLFTAAVPLEGQPLIVDNLRVHAGVGTTEVLVGQGSAPVIELALSRDAGKTWSDMDPAPLGAMGDYRASPRWRRLGMFDHPGAMFRFRVTDPVPVRVSGVFVNEPGGGRSR